MANVTMADLLAQQDLKSLSISRGQEVEGTIIAILESDVIIDLARKSEGVLPKKDLSEDYLSKVKVGDKITAFVVHPEGESGQVILSLSKPGALTSGRRDGNNRGGGMFSSARWSKFDEALKNKQVLTGKGLEVNKGGLIVEVNGIRGFLPSSQVSLSQASDLDKLVGKDVNVTVIEVDSNQNRLIFSQKNSISDDTKQLLGKLKVGDVVKGEVAAVLPFGLFVSIHEPAGVEGLVHISEVSWEKVEELEGKFKVGEIIESKVVSVDTETGRVNLSIKQLSADPFTKLAENYQPDDVVKLTITKVTAQGVVGELADGIEGMIPASKLEADSKYEVGQTVTCLVDNVDVRKRRIELAPFITSTKDLIYK